MSDSFQEVEFVAEGSGERLDKILVAHFNSFSRAQLQALIHEGLVMVNGRVAKASYRIEGGETIVVKLPVSDQDSTPQAESIPLEVLYEDDYLAVVNKPAGMVVHPAFGHTSGTLVNAILARWPQIAAFSEPSRAGIVHRLDKETSGVILVAKTEQALESLKAQFKKRTVEKTYLALVEGVPDTPEGVINAPIGRDPNMRKRMGVLHDGREAQTEFHVKETYGENSLLELHPKTGRTHQIRVHLAFIGHPVVGDTVYGYRKQKIKISRHFLHAASVSFTLPDTEQRFTVSAPLPDGLQNILDRLRAEGPLVSEEDPT
jgi:23S rRNA pseudouridine1911/1915/1917 synthase